jgi:hypothetical protein
MERANIHRTPSFPKREDRDSLPRSRFADAAEYAQRTAGSRRRRGGIDTESPYPDERPLLVAGQPEVREYRMRCWDKGTPNGVWTNFAKIALAP